MTIPTRPGRLRQLALALISTSLLHCTTTPDLVRRPEAPKRVHIQSVHVLDVESGRRSPPMDVLIEGDRITRIDPTGGAGVAGAHIIDGSDATLLPGLIDAHGHVHANPGPVWTPAAPTPEANLRSYLYSGVTTVMDPSDGSGDAFSRRDEIAAGKRLGPRVYTSGHALTTPRGHPVALLHVAAPWWIRWYLEPMAAIQVATPEAGREAVDRLARDGADFIKLIIDDIPPDAPTMDEATARGIVEAARGHGLRTVAHIGSTEEALMAARAGVAAWVHGVYTERISDEAIEELASFGIPMVPTLYVFENYASVLDGKRPPTPLEEESAPAALLAAFEDIPEESALVPVFEGWIAMLQRNRTNTLDNVRRLRAAGVTILAGSDTQSGVFPGPGLHRELALLTQAGLSPSEAIRAATLDTARFLTESEDPDFGSVAVGKRADLLLVDGDPRTDVAVLSRIRSVLLGGVPLDREAINEAP